MCREILQTTAMIVGAFLILVSSGMAVSGGAVFQMAHQLGRNSSVLGLAYSAGNMTNTIYVSNSEFFCAGMCTAALENCYAFNFIPMATGNDSLAMCELMRDRTWFAAKFGTHGSGRAAVFFVRIPWNMPKTDFVVIPAKYDYPETALPQGLWSSDCSAMNGTQGMLVAVRNFWDTSYTMSQFKCRMFLSDPAGGLRLDSTVPATVFNWTSAPQVVTPDAGATSRFAECPQGQVITAVQSFYPGFQVPSNMRCHQLAQPWFINTTNCRRIVVFRYDAYSPVSPLNDPNMTGTAESEWGAQCGNWITLEAMTAIALNIGGSGNPGRQAFFKCCRVDRAGFNN